MNTVWFVALVSAMCLEGLGRRYIPAVPSALFYFLKDVILLVGYVLFRPGPSVTGTARYLYRGFGAAIPVGILWTVGEMFNPAQRSFPLALIGLRSYWLWWISPLVFASALRNPRQKDRAIFALIALSVIVAAFAVVQFISPADSNVNMYSVWNGEEHYSADIAVVAATGRARVASTFAFITGFVDFTLLVPALLLSLGLDSKNPRVRTAALIATLITATVVPMSGSRTSVVIGAGILILMLWAAGLFFTKMGRRTIAGAVIAAVLSVVAFPEAFEGVMSRFEDQEETSGRFEQLASVLPPVALATQTYPALGIGTGMQQNARATFGISSEWDIESEVGRYLVELGPAGFLVMWYAKLGLITALLRSWRILKRAGCRGSAAAALSYAALTMLGNLTFDHNWQALYFMGCGFILSEVVAVHARAAAGRAPESSSSTAEPAVRAAPTAAIAGTSG